MKAQNAKTGSIQYRGSNTWKVIVDKAMIHRTDISFEARALWIALYSYTSPSSMHPYPGQKTLYRLTGWSKDTVQKYMRELRDNGFVSWRRKLDAEGRYVSNVYTLYDDPDLAAKDKALDKDLESTAGNSGCGSTAGIYLRGKFPPRKKPAIEENPRTEKIIQKKNEIQDTANCVVTPSASEEPVNYFPIGPDQPESVTAVHKQVSEYMCEFEPKGTTQGDQFGTALANWCLDFRKYFNRTPKISKEEARDLFEFVLNTDQFDDIQFRQIAKYAWEAPEGEPGQWNRHFKCNTCSRRLSSFLANFEDIKRELGF